MRERIKTSKLQSGKFLTEVSARKQTYAENGATGAVRWLKRVKGFLVDLKLENTFKNTK